MLEEPQDFCLGAFFYSMSELSVLKQKNFILNGKILIKMNI